MYTVCSHRAAACAFGPGLTAENLPEALPAVLSELGSFGRGAIRLQGEGIAFGNDCDTTRGVFVGPGADDGVFELAPAPFASCQSLEKETLGP